MKTRLFKYIENFTTKNWKFSDKISDIFHISAQNIEDMFLSRNKKNNVYVCKPQFYYIKVGFKGSKWYRRVFVMSLELAESRTMCNAGVPCSRWSKCIYSRLSLSRSPWDSLKYFEISVRQHIRFAELKVKKRTPTFHTWICNLIPKVSDIKKILLKKAEKLHFSSFPQEFVTCC